MFNSPVLFWGGGCEPVLNTWLPAWRDTTLGLWLNMFYCNVIGPFDEPVRSTSCIYRIEPLHVNVWTQKHVWESSSLFGSPRHLTLYCSPLTDVCVLPLGLSHLNWWCSAFYWPCSCFVCKESSWMYFISVLFEVLSRLIMLHHLWSECTHSGFTPANSEFVTHPRRHSADRLLQINLSRYNLSPIHHPEQQSVFVRMFPAPRFFHHLILPR